MQSRTQKSLSRSFALACLLQAAAALLAFGSAHAQVTSPFERTLAGASGSWQFFSIDIPAGTTTFNVAISGGTGDADLYVRPLEQPNDSDFSCRPWVDGNDEACATPNPQAATWFIALNAWTDFADVKLTATWDAPAAPTTPPTVDPTTPPTTDPTLAAWEQEMLDRHNLHRAKHCSPAMTWDAELAKAAQEWANRCVWEHAQGTGAGENLAAAAGTARTPTETADSWYSEIELYDFAAPGSVPNTGHFSQLVWKGSTRLGCAQATTCPAANISPSWASFGTAQLVVCRYAPQGNITGAYGENVAPVSEGGTCP
jgi:hypothetical protein